MSNGNHIGLLLDPEVLGGIRRKRTGTERIHYYNRAASALSLNVLYTSLPLIDIPRRRASGLLYVRDRWARKTVALPSVFHNRAMPFDNKGKRKLKKLSAVAEVFNRETRYSKLKIQRILERDPTTKAYVPETTTFSRSNLRRMMERHRELFIKPVSGSIGLGIISMARRKDGQWSLRKERSRTILSSSAARSVIVRRIGSRKPYLIQEGIPLASYKGRPFDLRVTVQRGATGAWGVTGSVAKIAARGKRVTNLGQGGTAKATATVYRHLGWDAATTTATVHRMAIAAAECLSRRIRGLADIGFDIGLTKDGKPYVIEMNGRDQRYSFRKARMKKVFYLTYATPIQYAAYRLRGGAVVTSGRRRRPRARH